MIQSTAEEKEQENWDMNTGFSNSNLSLIFFFFFFLRPHLQHTEVPGLGVELELQGRPIPQDGNIRAEPHWRPTLQLVATPDP